ncbi:hypothetical protein MKX03_035359 [Papaver bracteatum]|nr:hypothetical protein MKX03_035359 [Papaver bracteatum]
MNYKLILDNLIVGSQPLNFGEFDLQLIVKRCKEIGIRHMRRPVSEIFPHFKKGREHVHSTAGLERAPTVAITYMFWFCDMNLNTGYETLTSVRPCGPNKKAKRAATYDLAKDDQWKEPFESLPKHAFEDITPWERKLIQD